MEQIKDELQREDNFILNFVSPYEVDMANMLQCNNSINSVSDTQSHPMNSVQILTISSSIFTTDLSGALVA